MIERAPLFDLFCHVALALGLLMVAVPFALVVIAATHDVQAVNHVPMPLLPGDQLATNLATAWTRAHIGRKLFNSFVFAGMVAIGKVLFSSMAAFSIVYFRFRGRQIIFWATFVTLMLPLEVRIVPTYAVAANALAPFQALLDLSGLSWLVETALGIRIALQWNLLNSYTGLALPLVASATGIFLYRQFFLTVPEELAEAARMDGSGPVRFYWDILLPLSRPTMIAFGTIIFVWAWNQYLWPLLVTTDPDLGTAITGLKDLQPDDAFIPRWNVAMAGTLLSMLPPLLVVVFLQRWFVRGLISTEK